jgi:hypothetical protein
MTHSPGDADASSGSPPGIPRWVKLSALVVAVLVVVGIAIMLLAGGDHGPGRHAGDGALPAVHAALEVTLPIRAPLPAGGLG